MSVTLINVFTVPKGNEDEFVRWWENVKANITKQPGFISGKFYRSIKTDSRKAYEKSAAPMKGQLQQLGVEMTPALYNVAFEY